jgi:hypothetical protein
VVEVKSAISIMPPHTSQYCIRCLLLFRGDTYSGAMARLVHGCAITYQGHRFVGRRQLLARRRFLLLVYSFSLLRCSFRLGHGGRSIVCERGFRR